MFNLKLGLHGIQTLAQAVELEQVMRANGVLLDAYHTRDSRRSERNQTLGCYSVVCHSHSSENEAAVSCMVHVVLTQVI